LTYKNIKTRIKTNQPTFHHCILERDLMTPSNRLNRLLLPISALLVSLFLFSYPIQASEVSKALDQAAEYFVKSAVRIQSGKKLIISEVVNYNSKKFDALGKKIQNELYFALERQWPDYKLFVGSPEPDQVCISGSYEQKADQVIIKLQAFSGCGKPEILGQVTVSYKETRQARKALVAVLDIESKDLNPAQIRGFSEIFRSELDTIGNFDIASSADVYKFDPDAVQKATGCTRDECANIIGEQMGVDRVISSSLFKITDDQFVLSGKMLNIQTGEIVVSRTVDHNGSLATFKNALRALARKLTDQDEGDVDEASSINQKKGTGTDALDTADSQESWFSQNVWHITAFTGMTLGLYTMSSSESAYNDLVDENKKLQADYLAATTEQSAALILKKIESNEDTMDARKQDYEIAQLVFLGSALWETYLYFWGDDSETGTEAASSYSIPSTYQIALISRTDTLGSGLQIKWRW
jgi:hypothetical protein